MAFFLLIYAVLILFWCGWAGILVYHLLKYRIPHDESGAYLIAFIVASIVILFISFVFISRADWTTVPKILGG